MRTSQAAALQSESGIRVYNESDVDLCQHPNRKCCRIRTLSIARPVIRRLQVPIWRAPRLVELNRPDGATR